MCYVDLHKNEKRELDRIFYLHYVIYIIGFKGALADLSLLKWRVIEITLVQSLYTIFLISKYKCFAWIICNTSLGTQLCLEIKFYLSELKLRAKLRTLPWFYQIHQIKIWGKSVKGFLSYDIQEEITKNTRVSFV